MEIRQVLKSSASMIPVLFYKVSDGQTKPGGGERCGKGEAGIVEEVIGRIKDEQRVDFKGEKPQPSAKGMLQDVGDRRGNSNRRDKQ